MLPLGERAIAVARRLVGQREVGPNVGPIVDWSTHGLPVYVGAPRWCAYFVVQCLLQAAQPEERPLLQRIASGSCDTLWRRLSEQDEARPWAWRALSPEARTPPNVRAGCLVFFGEERDLHHVALVERVENGHLYTIGGNEGDAVSQRRRPLTDPVIFGYAEVRI